MCNSEMSKVEYVWEDDKSQLRSKVRIFGEKLSGVGDILEWEIDEKIVLKPIKAYPHPLLSFRSPRPKSDTCPFRGSPHFTVLCAAYGADDKPINGKSVDEIRRSFILDD